MKKNRIKQMAAWLLMGCLGLGQILSSASVVLAEDETPMGEAEVTFVNEEQNSPDLYISKTVTALVPGYEPDDPSATFSFQLTVDGKPYRDEPYTLLDAAGSEVEDPNGSYQTDSRGRFRLHAGETAHFDYVGIDASYEVKEESLPEYYQLISPVGGKASGTISKLGERVNFVNGYLPEQEEDLPTTFEVSKQIVWPEGFEMPAEVKDAKFRFTVTLDNELYTDRNYNLYGSDGKTKLGSGKTDADGRLSLSPNQKAVFSEVPMGVDYEVTEEPSEGWRTIGYENVEGVTETLLTRVPFTNTNGVFVVKKSMADGSVPEEHFAFRLVDVNQNGIANAKYVVCDADGKMVAPEGAASDPVRMTDASGGFSLKAGQSAVFFGMPNNAIYSIYEEANASYQQVVPQNVNGYRNEVLSNDSVKTYPFVNEKREEKSRLIVGKRVETAEGSIKTADPEQEFLFEIRSAGKPDVPFDDANPLTNTAFTMESGGGSVVRWTDGKGQFKLKSGELAVFDELDESKSYFVREAISDEQEGYELKSVKAAFDKDTDGADQYVYRKDAVNAAEGRDGTSFSELNDPDGRPREVAKGSKESNDVISASVDFSALQDCGSHSAQLTFTNQYSEAVPKGRITLHKKDEAGNALEGVTFELKSNGADGTTYTAVTDEKGEINFAGAPINPDEAGNGFELEKYQGLPQGTYTLTETGTKPGHTLLKDPITITIPMAMTQAEVENLKEQKIEVRTEGEDIIFDKANNTYYFYSLTYEITNSPNFVLPVSGSNGFWKLGFIGFAAFAAGIWYTLTTRRAKQGKPGIGNRQSLH